MRSLACLSLVAILAGCSGGGTFIPRKDGGADLAMSDGAGGGDGMMCHGLNQPCANPGDCCNGFSCVNSHCVQPNTCKNMGDGCTQADTCCNGLLCNSFDSTCEACGQNGARCTKNGDCCNGFACNLQTNFCQVSMNCSQNGANCNADNACCSGICNGLVGQCAACGSTMNSQCTRDAECCTGQGWTCNLMTDRCWMAPKCAGLGQACGGDQDCCNNLCNSFNLVCATCGSSVNSFCARDADCCVGQGWTCNLGTNHCQQGQMCGKQGAACVETVDCCQGYYCENSKCTNAPMCKVVGAQCVQYTDCCDAASLDCPSGICCIEKIYQDTTQIKCYKDADCCNAEKCVAGACT